MEIRMSSSKSGYLFENPHISPKNRHIHPKNPHIYRKNPYTYLNLIASVTSENPDSIVEDIRISYAAKIWIAIRIQYPVPHP